MSELKDWTINNADKTTEVERMCAADGYFFARPQIDNANSRKLFEEAFDRGYLSRDPQVAELKELLKPVAALLQDHHASQHNDTPLFAVNGKQITFGYLRRVDKALQGD